MPDYGRYCAVAMSSEVLADRWTPLIMRELVLGNTRFNEISRGLPGVSRTLLAQRLRHLERCGVLETWPSPTGRGSEYHLTPAGKDLGPVLEVMGRWSVTWLYDEFRDDVEATTLMWWMHRRVDDERLPPQRVIIEFVHTAPVVITIWLVLDRGEASVCMQYPGTDADLVVRTTTPVLARVFSGAERWSNAVAAGSIEVAGPAALARKLPTWFLWSPWADDVRARMRLADAR
ncbi:MAG: transcriptional regulator [Actinobacteria bacterium]|nr:transcriptional regulator [Actinomycetota bacterium]